MNTNHLIVVAHPDDEILGFGGAGRKFVNNGDKVFPLIISSNAEMRSLRPSTEVLFKNALEANMKLGFERPIFGGFPNIRLNNVDHIDLVKYIENHISIINPTHIYTHHPNDLNNDHHQVSIACQAAARLFQRDSKINPLKQFAFMEIPSSTDWAFSQGNDCFNPNYFVDIKNTIDDKLAALRCYKGVLRNPPHSRSEEGIKALSIYRGGQSNSLNAEAFQLVYKKID